MFPKPTLENQDREELLQSSRRLLAETQALSSRIAAVNEIATAMNSKLDLNEILRVVGKQAKWLLDFEHCSVCIRRGAGWHVQLLFGSALAVPDPYMPAPEGPLGRALRTGQAQIVKTGDPHDFLQGYASQILIPLRSEGTILGTIHYAKTASNAYTAEDLRIGYLLALQLSMAIRNAQILEELRQARDELEKRNQELDAYNHTIAHDLKTPLQSILSYIYLLNLRNGANFDDKSKAHAKYIQDAAQKMGQMIDQLLWLARLRNDARLKNVVPIKPVLDSALLRLQHSIQERGVEISIDNLLPPALGQAQWIEEIFANLLSNAVKYIGKDNPAPHIWISGKCEAGQVRYEVRDNGIGIAPEAQAKLFQMFTRLHTQETDGLGLGLSIVRRIIQQLDGRIGIESTPGEGSIFWFTLPAVQEGVEKLSATENLSTPGMTTVPSRGS